MYIVYFVDGERFYGGDLENSKWNEMPNKSIKKIEYTLFDENIILENYEQYNHIIEKVYLSFNNQTKITKIFLIGKKRNITYIYIFDLFNKKILRETAEFGKEYYGKSTSGWKKGIIDIVQD